MYPITPEELNDCWKALKSFAPKSISWNHYDFAIETEITNVELWKAFLLNADVREWLDEERALLQDTELAKLTSNVSGSRSVGQAQLISAMGRLNDANKDEATTGPAFIYCYVPLTTDQQHAPNVQMLTEDIFYVGKPNAPATETKPTSKLVPPVEEFKFE